MKRKQQDGLVPIAEARSGLSGPVKVIRDTSPPSAGSFGGK